MPNAGVNVAHRSVPLLRSERVAMTFFVYLLGLGLFRGLPWTQIVWLVFPPALIFAAVRLEQTVSRPWTRVTREFINLGFILAAYWSVEWFNFEPKRTDLQLTWLDWDRVILHSWGLHNAIEALGGVIPYFLETVYMLLYAIPPIYLTILFTTGARRRTHRFLFVVLAGTLAVYACLPYFPVIGPRIAYPGVDLPSYTNAPRQLNTWLHDNADISTSVFPSGHVGVAFSTAFGLVFAVPERRRLILSAFIAAALVWVATIYCRYHYTVDGFASIFITFAVWFACKTWDDTPNAPAHS